jgi:transcriptional regulator with XRE-family HTH domain
MVVRRGNPRVTGLVVICLRSITGLTQQDFGRRSRVSQSDVSRFENGVEAAPEAALRRMAETARVEWPVVEHLLRFFAAFLEAIGEVGAGAAAGRPLDASVLDAVLLGVASYLLEDEREPAAREPGSDAREIWEVLERFPAPRRRELIELAPPGALSPAAALELADLARPIGD